MGQFGVGMKRTFFRLGRHFIVRSSTTDARFTVDVDVDQWMTDGDSPDNWQFQFTQLETGLHIKEKDTVRSSKSINYCQTYQKHSH